MTEIPFDEFVLPSETSGGSGGNYPSLGQLQGRLVHILPVTVKYNATSPLRKDPHTQITVDLTFFDGEPITVVLDKNGRSKSQVDPPLTAGVTQQGRFMNQSWFTKRLADKAGRPGYPGMIGRISSEPTDSGNDMWMLSDPTPAEIETIKRWWAWKNANPGAGVYVPNPQTQPQYTQAPGRPPVQPQYAPAPAQPQYAPAPAQPQYAPAPAQPQYAPAQPAPADPWTVPPAAALQELSRPRLERLAPATAPQAPQQPADPWAVPPAPAQAQAQAQPAPAKLPWE
jgi:hypothetical protein